MANPGSSLSAWRRVADGVYLATAQPAAVNIGLVMGRDAAVVVDSGSSPEQGAIIRSAATRFAGVPLHAVVITHSHFDHAFGIAGFAGLDSIGHESITRDLTSAEAAAKAAELGVDPTTLQPPSRPIAIADAVELGGDRVAEVVHLGPAHAAGDLIVNVTGIDVIFAGDLIETAGPPWFGTDSDPDQWPRAVHQLATTAGPATRIIPGHGEPTDREEALSQRDVLDDVRSEIERLFQAGVAVEDALEAGEWPIPAEHVADGIAAGYARLGAAAPAGPTDTGGRTTLPLA